MNIEMGHGVNGIKGGILNRKHSEISSLNAKFHSYIYLNIALTGGLANYQHLCNWTPPLHKSRHPL